jgi:hypothetical protein
VVLDLSIVEALRELDRTGAQARASSASSALAERNDRLP